MDLNDIPFQKIEKKLLPFTNIHWSKSSNVFGIKFNLENIRKTRSCNCLKWWKLTWFVKKRIWIWKRNLMRSCWTNCTRKQCWISLRSKWTTSSTRFWLCFFWTETSIWSKRRKSNWRSNKKLWIFGSYSRRKFVNKLVS